jgi:hypothetical protein
MDEILIVYKIMFGTSVGILVGLVAHSSFFNSNLGSQVQLRLQIQLFRPRLERHWCRISTYIQFIILAHTDRNQLIKAQLLRVQL